MAKETVASLTEKFRGLRQDIKTVASLKGNIEDLERDIECLRTREGEIWKGIRNNQNRFFCHCNGHSFGTPELSVDNGLYGNCPSIHVVRVCQHCGETKREFIKVGLFRRFKGKLLKALGLK